ncbi:Clp protease ClpP [Agathobaculum sp. NTUH-O15-33]|uniref:head maturation protease, ClpP-related n=1 Tax=Agathobaculum sp. NTUH-O15-33 TaxID=3079302 RepID=UPI002958B54A|nr:head maturation protease, ClpP-related [Agathobaculum sp. NTUH-O15-33]WNX85248.1 Clp protease ClpP [Agathobaculum sp. NTUH-O15-33]
MKKYYALEQEGNSACVTVYGDITSWPWMESDVSAYMLSKQIDGIEADQIDVYINSYGGEVSEGLAIYNALKRHKAKVTTHCDGFACSAASVVFMAGDERIMGDASLLMIHNAWSGATGNAAELRKAADDLDTISAAAANAYRAAVNIDDAKLDQMLAEETWIAPQDAVDMGFATGIEKYEQPSVPAASARTAVLAKMQAKPIIAANVNVDTDAIVEKVFAKLTREAEPKQETKSNTFLNALMRGKEAK